VEVVEVVEVVVVVEVVEDVAVEVTVETKIIHHTNLLLLLMVATIK
jgi:hypothetical protein